MESMQIAKHMIDFNKTDFYNKFSALKKLHEQTERIVTRFWEDSPKFPEEGKQVISEWMKSYKEGREDFEKRLNDDYKKVEDFFIKSK